MKNFSMWWIGNSKNTIYKTKLKNHTHTIMFIMKINKKNVYKLLNYIKSTKFGHIK